MIANRPVSWVTVLGAGLVWHGPAGAHPGHAGIGLELLQVTLMAVILLVTLLLVWLQRRGVRKRPLAYLYRLKGRKPARYGITREICRIGRHPNNELRLMDRTVSRFHAELVRNANGTFSIHDAGSRNGIQVGLRPVRSSALRDGDVIGIGKVRLKFSRYPRDYNVHRNTDMLTPSSSRFDSRRRRERRASLSTQVRVYNEDTGWANGWMRNVGRGGAFIQTSAKLAPRLPVDIVVAIAKGRRRRWAHMSAEVVWSDARGVGISFTDRDTSTVDRLMDAA